ncbi:lipopolysaccharide heptosyltransferase II [Paraburkholderia caballeronis]|uniref:lipopolysaccharide heptosyltransferase II n=1 Tax=Paraburkholderia caballeronis TaxID=416943 RepID=UPI001064CB4B|nr:lipopolysaccharide heptosyltransferase II [Paraburkholderia caballeronis]TDV37846.1 lipopolysaccharide heptosyltransferase II [Paraburkholderia caballeronis]
MNTTPFAIAPAVAHAGTRRATPLSEPWGADVKRILCIRVDHLGDVLMTTPAFRALRASAPGRHLTLLTSPAGAAVAPFLADVDDLVEYDAPWVNPAPRGTPRDHAALVERLRDARFDAAAIFTVYSQNPLPAATLCYEAGIPRRLAHCRENPYALLTHWVVEPEPHAGVRHEVERQLALVREVGAETDDPRLRIAVHDADRDALRARLATLGIARGERYVVLHPGATAASRRYPPERYALALDALIRASGCRVLLTGSAGEAALTRGVLDAVQPATRASVIDLAGAFALGEFVALIESAALLIANNSGPVHIAAALCTPVVDLYALTNPQHTPWQTPHRLLYRDVACRWCYRGECPAGHHLCLLGIEPEAVAQAALDLLQPGLPRDDEPSEDHEPEPPLATTADERPA